MAWDWGRVGGWGVAAKGGTRGREVNAEMYEEVSVFSSWRRAYRMQLALLPELVQTHSLVFMCVIIAPITVSLDRKFETVCLEPYIGMI